MAFDQMKDLLCTWHTQTSGVMLQRQPYQLSYLRLVSLGYEPAGIQNATLTMHIRQHPGTSKNRVQRGRYKFQLLDSKLVCLVNTSVDHYLKVVQAHEVKEILEKFHTGAPFQKLHVHKHQASLLVKSVPVLEPFARINLSKPQHLMLDMPALEESLDFVKYIEHLAKNCRT
ncbi:hypothetical protein SELMODRAFT_412966 [Selaginella moellendorffii]|uniref:Uncharacterized protein n=1 Tax=Selaginella moellendorffii TaxID=88036 RepID=D8RMX5_SELML|nr:hypothetical protein SELMODRAFT_412966 [Selaginella moellendorffii]